MGVKNTLGVNNANSEDRDTILEELRMLLREDACPMFTDDEIMYWYDKLGKQEGLYELFQIKAYTGNIALTGMTVSDTSAYFLRIGQRYRPNHSASRNDINAKSNYNGGCGYV